ncbi:MAG: N-acetyl-gamma-glutamyl-phosphate reductase [bacterium]|nr:N-acetyl-gamma-glutamyl-phosphate reductase [Planctomycetota bacterium]HIL52506.1 N-acetyl-gamma-glutamyl-phosphate reductase [Planctomycetota bacterium]
MKIPIWIVGAKGLLAGELARLLEDHPHYFLAGAVTREGSEALIHEHPFLTSAITCVAVGQATAEIERDLASGPAGLFLALPHGEAAGVWKTMACELGSAAEELAVVDLSADFRLQSPEHYAAAYGREHPDPAGDLGFVYGLPELYRSELTGARRVAAPGCFATAMQLACIPAAAAGLIAPGATLLFQGVTGSSGSGAVPGKGCHHPYRNGNFKAYSLAGHRHEAEVLQALAAYHGQELKVHLVPHSGPFARGIHMTLSLPLAGDLNAEEATSVWSEFYAGEPFIQVLPAGGSPELRWVVGSNRVSLGVHVRDSVCTVLLVLDNTLKGGAGQALQNMNLCHNLPETAGLARAGLGVL